MNLTEPPVVKTGYPPEDILLSDPGKTAARLRRYILSQNVNTDTMIRFCGIFRFDGTVMADVFHRTGHPRHHAWFGEKTDATPDGRRRGDAFMIGIGQSDGKDRRGLTALLRSVSQMDPHAVITGAYVCNVYLEESLVRDKDKFDLTLRILYRYFMDGGVHVQLNYVSKDELLKAKAHPEDYPSLRVRVTGFSGHFTNLQEEMQDEIIKRTVIGGR